MKACYSCKQFLPIEYFHKNKHYPDGLQNKCKSCTKITYQKNRAAILSERKALQASPNYKEYKKEYDKRRCEIKGREMYLKRKDDPRVIARRREFTRRRRMHISQAMPIWITDSDRKKIKSIYELAVIKQKETGIKYHVDHIIPLRGKTVCGLHIPDNLQIIPARDNMKKSNRIASW